MWELSGETYRTTDAPSKQQLLPRGTTIQDLTIRWTGKQTQTHTKSTKTHTHNDMHCQLTHKFFFIYFFFYKRASAKKECKWKLKTLRGAYKYHQIHTHANTLSKGSCSTHTHVMTETDSLLTVVPDNGSKLSPKRLQSACNLVLSELTLYSNRAGDPTGLIVQQRASSLNKP